jgi:integrase
MRRGELRALKFERINWTDETITVIENLGRYGVGSPKNGKSRRVAIGGELLAALDLHWRSRGKSSGLVFLSEVRTALPNTTIDRYY